MRPSFVYIDGRKVDIHYISQDLFDGCYAQWCPQRSVIEISEEISDACLDAFLGHEIIHSMLCWTGLSELTSVADKFLGGLGSQIEEAVCDAIGAKLFQFIRANRHLLS